MNSGSNNFARHLFQQVPVEALIKPWQCWIIFLLFLFLIPYPLFHGLDALVLRQYDDARRGVNAYEMLHNGNLLVTHYDGKPDLWGTKPPLLVWMQAGFMLFLGPGELAVRLPSAIAGLMTCLLLLFISYKYLKNFLFGFIWATVLITFNGYVDFHGTRTGDFDALLTLFMFLYAFFFFLYTDRKNPKYIFITAVFITLAVMTKGIAGLFFLPALYIWAIITRSLKDLLLSRQTWLGLGLFILIVGGYYFSREMIAPGYLKAVSSNELGGRYLQSLEGHHYQLTYYIDLFIYPRLHKWAAFIIPGMIAGFFIKEGFLRKLNLLSIILVISHLLIITFSGTKLPWYDLPEYPFIALMIANFIWAIMVLFWRFYLIFSKRIMMLLPVAFLVLIFYEPIRLTFKEANYLQERPWYLPDHEIAKFLREGVRDRINLDGYVLVHEDYDAQCIFYLDLLRDKEQYVTRKSKEMLTPGNLVIAHQSNVKEYIERHYSYDVLESRAFVKVYRIL